MKRINSGRATFIDTARYSQVLSHILGSEVSKMILNVNDREAVVSHLLHDSYEDINDVFGRVQRDIDKKKGLNIKPRQGEYPGERVEQFVHSLVDPTVEDSVIERRARAGTETITKSFHDDCIEENAKLHEEAGLKTYIIRMGTDCCSWCSEVAGKYEMKDQPQGIFRRHDNCDCTVIYDGQVLRGQAGDNGKRSKKWVEVPKDAGAAAAPRLSQEQARNIEQEKLYEDEADLQRIKNAITGNGYKNTISDFEKELPNIENKALADVLGRASQNVNYAKSDTPKSHFNKTQNTIYLTNSAEPSTVAHELFHKIDYENEISIGGMLDKCIDSDYERLLNKAKSSGQTIEDMLYLKYQEAFAKKGKLDVKYRGISDIIEGLTNGKTRLGYGHIISNADYWKSPYRVQKETFAQYGRMLFERNENVLKMLKEIFPDTTDQITSIITAISKFGR